MGEIVAVVAAVAVVLLLRAMVRAASALSAGGFALIAAGAAGNLCDRVLRGDGLLDGHVVDFIDLHFGSYIYPTFNVADSGICVGVLLYLWQSLRTPEPGKAGK